jgi:GNAT superfamily N-acetyltransferase
MNGSGAKDSTQPNMTADGFPNKIFEVSNDNGLIDQNWVVDQILKQYWGVHRNREQILRSMKNSLNYGLYEFERPANVKPIAPDVYNAEDRVNLKQIAYCRVLTDYATVSLISDVIVEEPYRGKGFGKFLLSQVLLSKSINGTVCLLRTKDQHEFYRPFGFQDTTAMLRKPGGAI